MGTFSAAASLLSSVTNRAVAKPYHSNVLTYGTNLRMRVGVAPRAQAMGMGRVLLSSIAHNRARRVRPHCGVGGPAPPRTYKRAGVHAVVAALQMHAIPKAAAADAAAAARSLRPRPARP